MVVNKIGILDCQWLLLLELCKNPVVLLASILGGGGGSCMTDPGGMVAQSEALPVARSRFQDPGASIPPGSINWYKTCLGM